MGSLTNNPGQLAAPMFQPFPNGLDLNRCVIQHEIGVWAADPATTFLQGQLVTKAATGIQQAAGKNVLGVAKWNKALTLFGVNVDEQVSFATANAVVNLKKSNVSNVSVRSAAGQTGTTFTVTTDYTVQAVNGTVTQVGAGTIPLATTVFVTYTYQLASTDFDFQGRNFWNFTDDVTIQDGRITVITGWNILFTTQYDSSRTYGLTGVTSNLYCGGGSSDTTNPGLFTTFLTNNEFVGHVVQLPSATDPFLGVSIGGMPAVQ